MAAMKRDVLVIAQGSTSGRRPLLGRLLRRAAVAGLGAAAALGVASGATAIDWWDQQPPVRYQSSTSYRVEFITPGAVGARCRQLGSLARDHISGCVAAGVMVLPNPCASGDPYAALACHELAHVNGWRH